MLLSEYKTQHYTFDVFSDVRIANVLQTIGIPYHYGAGDPSTIYPADRYDCSGYAQGLLVKYNLLKSTEIDRTAYNLAMISNERNYDAFGFLAFYGNPVHHVMFCLGGGWVIGACGGNRKTKSNNLKAFVQLKKIHYRKLTCVGEIKDEYKNSI